MLLLTCEYLVRMLLLVLEYIVFKRVTFDLEDKILSDEVKP
ncbi:hypothetical protein X760_31255 [Mesorhizobium sp. LSHC422A00]|nr:hypothetical protein X760_31255 [Mesorhizobium sp. LSHC422A00]